MSTILKAIFVISTGAIATLIANFCWDKFKLFTTDVVTISNMEYQAYLLGRMEPESQPPDNAAHRKDCVKSVFDQCVGLTAVGFVNQLDNKLMEPQTINLCQSLKKINPMLKSLAETNLSIEENKLTATGCDRVLVGFMEENKLVRSDSILREKLPQLRDMISSEIDVRFLVYDSRKDSVIAQCAVKEYGIGKGNKAAIQNALDKILFTYLQN